MKSVLRLCTKIALKSFQVMKKKKKREREIDISFHFCIVYFGEEKNTLDSFSTAFQIHTYLHKMKAFYDLCPHMTENLKQCYPFLSKTTAMKVLYKIRKMTKFCVFWGTQTHDGKYFVFPFGIERCHCVFSLNTFLEPLAHRTDLDNCEFRWKNINSFLTRDRCRRHLRRCLSSLLCCTWNA